MLPNAVSLLLNRLKLLKSHLFKKGLDERYVLIQQRAKNIGWNDKGLVNLCLWANVPMDEDNLENVLASIESFVVRREDSLAAFSQ